MEYEVQRERAKWGFLMANALRPMNVIARGLLVDGVPDHIREYAQDQFDFHMDKMSRAMTEPVGEWDSVVDKLVGKRPETDPCQGV